MTVNVVCNEQAMWFALKCNVECVDDGWMIQTDWTLGLGEAAHLLRIE